MGFLDFLSPRAIKPGADASRRKFLRNLVVAAPAAIAAAAAIDLKFVPEVVAAARDELRKLDQMVEGDLGMKNGRILVAMPQSTFDPNVRIWRSVALEAGAWAEYVSKTTGINEHKALSMCTRLANLVDRDLRDAEVDYKTKIEVNLPTVTRQWTDSMGHRHCEIGLGLHKAKLFDGTEQFQVAFKNQKPPALVGTDGKPLAADASRYENAKAA